MLVIVDYGVGNLFSLKSSFSFIGIEPIVSGDPDVIEKAERIILPGVGAFADAAAKLKESGLGEIVKKKAADGTPIMGICLGMQLLFESSMEYGIPHRRYRAPNLRGHPRGLQDPPHRLELSHVRRKKAPHLQIRG